MYTTCPSCARQYRIRAEQLSVAEGEVRCGFCGEQFNALKLLSDEPLAGLAEVMLSAAPEDIQGSEFADVKIGEMEETPEELLEPEPQFDIPESIDSKLSGVDEDENVEEVDLDEVNTVEEIPGDLPAVLLEGQQAPRNLFISLFWGIGSLLLTITVVTQLAWFNRDYILREYPEWLPEVKQVCEYFNCDLLRHRNINAIRLVNRDVRLHPVYSDTLLVNATISNHSVNIQPFPHIQLTLFDIGGEMVAFREFNPSEYLDNSITIEEGMKPNQPVHLVLEVAGPTENAVSFEFRFLNDTSKSAVFPLKWFPDHENITIYRDVLH